MKMLCNRSTNIHKNNFIEAYLYVCVKIYVLYAIIFITSSPISKVLPELVIRNIVFFTANFVTSRYGKQLIELDGYTYCSTPSKGLKVRWRCSTHKHAGCRATLYTVENHVIFIKNEHNHLPPKLPKI